MAWGKMLPLLILHIIFLHIWYFPYVSNFQLIILRSSIVFKITEYSIFWSYFVTGVSMAHLAKLSFNTLEIGHAISARPLDIIKEYCHPEHLFNFFYLHFWIKSRITSLRYSVVNYFYAATLLWEWLKAALLEIHIDLLQ